MSHATSKRTARGRIQPYAWLGVGAVTLGMGAAMIGGTAVAYATTGTDSGSASTSSDKAGNDSAPSPTTNTERRAAHTARGNDSAGTANTTASAPVRRGRSSAVVDVPDTIPTVTEPAQNNKPLPAAAVRASRAAAVSVSAPAQPAPAADTGAPVVDVPAPVKVADPAPTAAIGPAANPTPSADSWLPVAPIIPGAHVKLALDQITASQTLLKQETSGNILASLGSLGPQAALATAQLLLGLWSSTIADAQNQVKNTVGQPLIHNIAQARLQNEVTYTKLAGLSLQTASALITPLGWFGADVAPTKALVADATQNAKVYAKVPVQIVAGTEPVVKAKLNGGFGSAKLLVDTGASGIVTTSDKIGNAALGPKIGAGDSCFSGGLCYHYDTYNMTVDLGDGATTTAPVNIVTDTTQYPDSVKNFKSFFSWGADGILGIGANTAGPGPTPIPTAAMPGELSDGALIYQKANLLGGGYMMLGPNLFPTRVSVPGAPDAYVKVSINGGAKQDGGAIIDSGGVYGTLNRSFMPGVTGDNVPAGTKIDVYTKDGSTLLYSYTTKSGSSATPFIESGLFNTGNAPYAQGPIYINYATDPYTGFGSTDFSIY